MKYKILTAGFLLISALTFGQQDSASLFLQKGMEEKQKGRRMESLKNFEKAYKYDSTNKVIVRELAAAYNDLRKYHFAKEKFLKLEQLGDNSPANLRQIMDLSFNMRQHDDAILYANKLKKADGSQMVAFVIGKAHYDKDNYGDAIKYLNIAMKEEPKNAEAPYLIARGYADMMNYKQAISYFEKAISIDDTKAHWYYELGLICYAMQADKKALEYILLAGEKGYRKDNDYLENLGIAYLNVGNLTEGVKIMEEILKRRPSDMNILNMVAEAYYYGGKYTEAIGYWDQVLGYDKESASALYMIGMCYQKKGEKEKGVALCDKAIEMDPSLSSLKTKKSMPGM